MPARNYNRNARFQLRLPVDVLASLKAKAARQDLPVNQLIAVILERAVDDDSTYFLRMAGKHSFLNFALLNVIATRLLPAESRREILKTIGEQAERLFGPNPTIPDEIALRASGDEPDYVAALFSLFHRLASDRWNIRAD